MIYNSKILTKQTTNIGYLLISNIYKHYVNQKQNFCISVKIFHITIKDLR